MAGKQKRSSSEISLYSPLEELKGIGPKKAESLEKLGLFCFADALDLYPREYEDLRCKKQIADLEDGEKAVVTARVLLVRLGRGYGKKRTLHVLTEDNTGRMEVLFFAGGFLAKQFRQGDEFRFFGKVKVENGRVTMFHPSYVRSDGEQAEGIQPVYPLTRGVTQKDVRLCTSTALMHTDELPESLPEAIVKDAKLCSNAYALANIHYPENDDKYREARYRLVYEELFYLDAALAMSKTHGGRGSAGRSITGPYAQEFIKTLPYELTGAQKRVLSEVLSDMASGRAMNRLVQGDVGSGKTVIAAAAMLQSAKNGCQSAFMAPTDILAHQHFETLKKLFSGLGINVELLSGNMPAAERKRVLSGLADGSVDVAVGTHALISEGVKYRDLALVITDEQHRFGVNQRQNLSAKGVCPDVLVMTATPIPRTLAVVLYADLDVSVIDELPPGRIPIITKGYTEETRDKAYDLLVSEVGKGRQAYIVAPFIEDSEAIDGMSAEGLFAGFAKDHPDIRAELLHGRMSQQEKDSIMERFYSGQIQVLVSTVVIEVGIDVPDATVMLIENSERFGLAQMHQLRGRVGRGKHQSYCLIVTCDDSQTARERADIMCSTSDGFVIAEKDLEIRGPGEFFGFRQHGLPQLKMADPVKHMAVAQRAKEDVRKLLAQDPKLASAENAVFAKNLADKYMQAGRLTL
ncbi:MAG: ATP-dependent DNA helicase RecG [Firmicutes bacterium]|nr:ATP-dependent DNA helicase RecG [Bacillota bacterium]